MAKSKGINLASLITLIAAVLGLVAFFMMFAPAATVDGRDTTYSGANLAFGYNWSYTLLNQTVEVEIFKFSFMNLLTYILLVVGIIFGVLSALGKLGKISGVVSAVCYLVAGIFFFCVIAFSALNDDFSSAASALGFSSKDGLVLGAGAIVAGVLSIVAAIATAASAFLLKK